MRAAIGAVFALGIVALASSQAIGFPHHKLVARSCLPVMSRTATTDLHLVADDWTGSGSWTDRSGAGNHATIVAGSPTAANGVNLGKCGRKSILLTGNTFDAPEPTWSASTVRTYEFVFDSWDVSVNKIVMGTNAANRWYFQQGTVSSNLSVGLIDSAGAALYLGAVNFAGLNPTTDAIARLITITADMPTTTMKAYLNGTIVNTDTTVSGSWSPSALALRIGGATTGARISEILRHEEVLDAATIATRASPFNQVRGY